MAVSHRKTLFATIAAFVLVLTLLAPAEGWAQNSCEDALRQAQKSYDLGLFEDVRPQLAPCLTGATSRRVAIEVHALIARAELNNDEPDNARKEISTILALDPAFDAGSPTRFAELVARVRRDDLTTQVASVSKTSESLREAPATVMIVTSDEIQRRGYLDLEQLLGDLPGFDVTRGNGSTYSWIDQRGYVSINNDRLIFLVDGVEQGDLSDNTVYVSRQYPLSNIERVEIIYGPASTMYGANAYTGVISIITKQAEALVTERNSFGLRGQTTAGASWRMVDMTGAGRNRDGTLAWSLAASVQSSREPDLSKLPAWDYTYKNIDYKRGLALSGTKAERDALCGKSPYIECSDSGVTLTSAGESLVRGLDAALASDNHLGFDDRAKNWGINGMVRFSGLTVGLQAWRSQEGAGTDLPAKSLGGNTEWTPRFTSFYLKYAVPLDRFKVNIFSRFLQTSVEQSHSHYTYLHDYANGYLNLFSLVAPCQNPYDTKPVDCAPARPWVEDVRYGLLSAQFRNEINVAYDAPGKWTGVAGVELAKSSIQSTFSQDTTGPGQPFANPSITPAQIEHTDAAVFAQASYKPRPSLKLLLAGRLTHNEINNQPGVSGYGTLFTPRAAVVYSAFANALTLKAIYAEAFKDPTDHQKFNAAANALRPETVRNIELSAAWQPSKDFSIEAAAYHSKYSDVVDCVSGCDFFENAGAVDVRGEQATGRYRRGRYELSGNYTQTRSFDISSLDDENGNPIPKHRIAYIAPYRANARADIDWTDRVRTSVRAHYVAARTSDSVTVGAYATADAVFGYRLKSGNTALQVILQNISGRAYFAPSPVGGVPQKGRALYLRLIYGGAAQ
ncbi:MAG: outer rane receptor for ferrienterochelin and colicin [Thermoanaerobaculia bacterium]|jgi:outer membrane receptor protein involved in Fe transport|nr:outer rane receptor for ferrienterochelin and colicin [Thermoanaerobaculia bacterium]